MKKSLLILLGIFLVPTFLLEMWRFTAVFAVIFLVIALVVIALSFITQRPAREASFWIGTILVIGFYWFCASTSERKPEIFASYPAGYYDRLVDSFQHHQLSVIEPPDPKLLALENPYLWSNRGNINTLWDLSLYHGKYYVYWGVSPVLTFYWPMRAISGSYVHEWFACFVFASLAFLFCALFLRLALRQWFARELDAGETFLMMLAIGFSSTFPYMLRRPAVYENAILAAVTFLFMSLYLLLQAIRSERKGIRELFFALAGLTYALSIGSRPTFLFTGLIHVYLIYQEYSTRKKWSELFSFAIPVAIYGTFLGIYNYLRFDSFTEFGLHYQLTTFDIRSITFHAPDFWNAWKAYLLNMPDVQIAFPFFKVVRIHAALGSGHLYLNDEVLGILIAAPIFWLLGLLCFKTARAVFSVAMLRLFLLFYVAIFGIISVDCVSGIQERYTGDFALLVQIVPLFLLFQLYKLNQKRYRAVFGVFALLIVFGFTLNFFTSFTGIENRFETSDKPLYTDLKVIFGG